MVLLPGVYETWQFLKPIADRLNTAGHPIHVVRSLGYNVRDIPLSARTVASFLVEHDLRHVVVVAHSKGGLIGKYLMTIGDVEGRVDRLVAINTPFSGSASACFDPHIPVGSELAGAHNVLLPIMGHFRPLGHRLLIDAVISAVDGDEGSPHDPIRGLQE